MKRAYRALLKLYPYDFTAAFAAEMLAAFERVDCASANGPELAGLLRGAAAEWIAKADLRRSRRAGARYLPDLRMMRPAGMPRELWFGRTPCSSDTSR
jgi:hypothetical protein